MEELSGRPQRAEDAYRKALQVKPDLGAAANNLAYLMLENRESTDEALYLARIARQRMPDSPSAGDTLAWAYYQKAHYDMAASTARSRAEGAQQCHVPVPYLEFIKSRRIREPRDKHLQRTLQISPNFPGADEIRETLNRMSS